MFFALFAWPRLSDKVVGGGGWGGGGGARAPEVGRGRPGPTRGPAPWQDGRSSGTPALRGKTKTRGHGQVGAPQVGERWWLYE